MCALDHNDRPIGAEFGTVEGNYQTVPRAELRAVFSIFSRVPCESSITIKVDATYLLGFREDPDNRLKSDNGDFWLECWRLMSSKRIELTIEKIVKSHATDDMV